MRLYGLAERAVEVEPGCRYELGPFTVTFVPSLHSKLLLGFAVPFDGELTCEHLDALSPSAYRCGQVWGIHVEVAGMTFYHQGSANLIDDALQHRGVDVFLAGVAGRSFTRDYWARILGALQPRTIVASHFDDFLRPVDAAMGFSTNVNLAAVPDEVAAGQPRFRRRDPHADAGRGIRRLILAGRPEPEKVSDALDRWLRSDGEKTLDSLIELVEEKSFAILFVLLLGVPALPLPTGGATHVFELIAVLLALQLIAGREQIWLPQRWCKLELAGARQQRFIAGLMRMIRRLERLSRPRLRFLFDHRSSSVVFGLLVIAGSIGAFLAPPFTGLDTLPSLGVVLLSLGMLLEDFALVVVALVVGVAGVALEIVLGSAAIHGLGKLF